MLSCQSRTLTGRHVLHFINIAICRNALLQEHTVAELYYRPKQCDQLRHSILSTCLSLLRPRAPVISVTAGARIRDEGQDATLRTSGRTWSGRAMSWTASTVSIMSYVGTSGRPSPGLPGFSHDIFTCPKPFSFCLAPHGLTVRWQQEPDGASCKV